MVNPLEARVVDATSPFSGAFLIQDGQALVDAVNSGDWVDGGIAAVSAALDTAATVIDPIGTLIANGLGWVLDHIEPLKGWMTSFTGDAAHVTAFAQTWRNVGARMHDSADLYAKRTYDLDGMSGATIDAYLLYAGDAIKHLKATGDWANAIATGLEVASEMVQVVHDLVRDAISQVVGTAISVAAEMALTFGLATPAAIGQIATKASSLATRIGKAITRLLTSFKNLHALLDELKTLFSKSSGVISRMLHGGAGASHPSSTPIPVAPIGGAERPRLPDPIKVDFNLNNNPPGEFGRQLKDQERGLNNLTVEDFLRNRDDYIANGRSTEGRTAQSRARTLAREDKVDDLLDQGYSEAEAERLANEWLDTQAALHAPDQVAGGHPHNITGVGDGSVNSSLGGQWQYRIPSVDQKIRDIAKNMTPDERTRALLNIILSF